MDKNLEKALEYCYKNKNGLKMDLISKFNKDTYDSLAYSNLITPCVRFSGELSWIISKEGYTLYILLNPKLKYRDWITKIQDFFEYIFYFKFKKKEYLKNENNKENYFKY